MALWVCQGCTAAYAVGAPKCPQCGGTDHVEEGQDDMPKITVHGGATDEFATDDPEGGEQPSPGSSSSTSSAPAKRSPRKNKPAAPSPAPTTENPSARGRTGSSTAAATDGGQTAATSEGEK